MLQMNDWNSFGNGSGSLFASGATDENLSHCFREIESAIKFDVVDICMALKIIECFMASKMNFLSKIIVLFDLHDCLFITCTRASLSILKTIFMFLNLSPQSMTANNTGTISKNVISVNTLEFPQILGHWKNAHCPAK